MDGKGPWRQAGEYLRPKEELEAVKAERQRYEELAQRGVHKRQPPKHFLGGGTRGDWWSQVMDSGERVTSQVPVYAALRRVSPVHSHCPVRSLQAPRSCRARVGIQPLIQPPPVRLFGPGYPAPALRTVSLVRQQNPSAVCSSSLHLPG